MRVDPQHGRLAPLVPLVPRASSASRLWFLAPLVPRDLLDSLNYRVSLSGKSRKNEKEKHIIQALSILGSGVSFFQMTHHNYLIDCYYCTAVRRLEITIVLMKHQPF